VHLFTNPYGTEVLSAGSTQGTVTYRRDGVAWQFGEVAPGSVVSATLQLRSSQVGTLYRYFELFANAVDPDMTNNTGDVQAEIAPAPGVDLFPESTSAWVDCRERRGAADRCFIEGSLWVNNRGEAPARRSEAHIYLSDDDAPDPQDRLLKTVAIRRIRSKGWDSVFWRVRVAEGLNAGGKFVIAVVDPDNHVVESHEENNVVAGPVIGP
jgi:hypothetical protein